MSTARPGAAAASAAAAASLSTPTRSDVSPRSAASLAPRSPDPAHSVYAMNTLGQPSDVVMALDDDGRTEHRRRLDDIWIQRALPEKPEPTELVGALRPMVAIMGNGARKGADPETWPILRAIPGLSDVWQVHYSEPGTADTNPPPDFIANLQGTSDEHRLIKLSVLADGTYSVTNTRNGFSRKYDSRQGKR